MRQVLSSSTLFTETEVERFEVTYPRSHIYNCMSQVCLTSKPRPSAASLYCIYSERWPGLGFIRTYKEAVWRMVGSELRNIVEQSLRALLALRARQAQARLSLLYPMLWEGRFPGSPCSKIPKRDFDTEERKTQKKWTIGYKIVNYSLGKEN